MTKFKEGDGFITRKPKKDTNELNWVPEMDIYNGVPLIVSEITELGYLKAIGIAWKFHPDWCEKVEEMVYDTQK